MGNTILIVDDNPADLSMLASDFRAGGFAVYSAMNCKEAIKLAFQYLPDCFLLDYHLGADTSLPICLSIRGCEQLREAPIVILSGDESQVAACYDSCQADAFVLKGHGYKAALAAVKRQLRRAGRPCLPLTPSDLVLDNNGLRVLKDGVSLAKLSQEQYRLFSLLFKSRPRCVPDNEIISHVFAECPRDPGEALASLLYRLRRAFGHPYARRIACKKGRGWMYIQPRLYAKTAV